MASLPDSPTSAPIPVRTKADRDTPPHIVAAEARVLAVLAEDGLSREAIGEAAFAAQVEQTIGLARAIVRRRVAEIARAAADEAA